MLRRSIRRPNQQSNFPARRLLPYRRQQILQMPAHEFLVQLRQFASNHSRPVSQNFQRVFQSIQQPVRRLVQRQGPRFRRQCPQPLPPLRRPRRQKPYKRKLLDRHPRPRQRRHKRARPRNRHHLNSMPQTQTHQPLPRVRNRWRPRIRNQRHFRALLQLNNHFRRARNLVVLVITHQPFLNIKMRQQLHRLPRVLARNRVALLQNPQRPQRNIFQIPNRRRYYIKTPHRRFSQFCRRSSFFLHRQSLAHALAPSCNERLLPPPTSGVSCSAIIQC